MPPPPRAVGGRRRRGRGAAAPSERRRLVWQQHLALPGWGPREGHNRQGENRQGEIFRWPCLLVAQPVGRPACVRPAAAGCATGRQGENRQGERQAGRIQAGRPTGRATNRQGHNRCAGPQQAGPDAAARPAPPGARSRHSRLACAAPVPAATSSTCARCPAQRSHPARRRSGELRSAALPCAHMLCCKPRSPVTRLGRIMLTARFMRPPPSRLPHLAFGA